MVKKYYRINELCHEADHGNKIFLYNYLEGTWVFINHKVWNNIQYYVQNRVDIPNELNKIVNKLVITNILQIDNPANPHRLENVTIMLTDRCNLKCIHCCAKDLFSGELVSEVEVRRVAALNPLQITLSGGEPLLHPEIIQLLQTLRAEYSGKIALATNGLLLVNYIDAICECVDKIEMSLDGFDKYSVDQFRGTGVFNKILENISLLKRYPNIRVALSMATITTTLQGQINIVYFNKLCQELGVVSIVRELEINELIKNNFDSLYGMHYSDYLKQKINGLCEQDIELKRCGMIKYQIFISNDGSVYPCAGLSDPRFAIGNIKDNDVTYYLQHDLRYLHDNLICRLLESNEFRLCINCAVRQFCWSCIYRVIQNSVDPELFTEFCKCSKQKYKRYVDNVIQLDAKETEDGNAVYYLDEL